MDKIISLFTALLLCYSCSFSQITTPSATIEHKDLLYVTEGTIKDDSLQRLNLVLPESGTNYPLFIWIGGGGWSYGDRNQEMNLAHRLGQAGIAVASVGHRLSPATWRDPKLNSGIQHPEHIKDVASAVKWLYDNAATYGYDQNKIFIGGYSSGAHLAALISLDNSYLAAEGLSPDLFKGTIPISGAFDIVNYHEVLKNSSRPELAELHVQAVFGKTKEEFIQASPISYLKHLTAPMLVICDNDMYNYTRLFEDKIRETDFRDMSVVYAYNFSHGELWRNLSNDEDSTYRKLIVDFIKKQSEAGSVK